MARTVETVHFNGHAFSRFPLSRRRSSRVYFTAYENGIRADGIGQLHVEIWKAANGVEEVPLGHVIHHADFNPLNNDPSNLVCITRKQHARVHEDENPQDSPEWLAHLAAIRPKSAEWHRTEEGREWHRRHGKATWMDRETFTRTCAECGKEYQATFKRSRFCTRRCNRRASDRKHRYEHRVPCPICAVPFWQSKYREKPTACSATCARALSKKRSQR